MRLCLALCRDYGQPPAWLDTLQPGELDLYLGEFMLRLEESRPRPQGRR